MFTDGLDVVGSCSAQALVDYTTAVLHVISICHARDKYNGRSSDKIRTKTPNV